MASNTKKNTSLFGNVPKVNVDVNDQSDARIQQETKEVAQPISNENKNAMDSSLAAQFKATCKANKNKQSDVIEQLLRLYVNSANV